MKKVVVYILPAVLLLVIGPLAYASNPVYSTEPPTGSMWGSDSNTNEYWGQLITPSSTATISQITLGVFNNSGTTDPAGSVRLCVYSSSSILLASGLSSSFNFPTGQAATTTILLNIPINFVSGAQYYLMVGYIKGTSMTNGVMNEAGTSPPSYGSATAQGFYNGLNPNTQNCANTTMYGVARSGVSYFNLTPSPSNGISIVSPAASSTGTPTNFTIQYSTATAPQGDPFQLQVWTGTDPAYPHLSASGFFPASTNTATATLPVAIGFAPDTNYYEYAVMNLWYDANTFQSVASSSPQYFTTTFSATVSATSTIYVAPTSTITSSTPIQITCDPTDPFFQYSLCNLALALFSPSPDALNTFQGLINQIKTKPPIGYFTIIAGDLSEFNSSSTPTLVIVAPAIVSTFGGAFGLLDQYVGIGIVLLFMWWLFHRFRHFEL